MMTPAEWSVCDNPDAMLAALANNPDPRRWRLFVRALLRELGHLLPDLHSRRSLLALQRADEGDVDLVTLAEARREAVASRHLIYSPNFPHGGMNRQMRTRIKGVNQALLQATLPDPEPQDRAIHVASILRQADTRDRNWEPRIRSLCCEILRDIFGNPYEPLEVSLAWLNGMGREAVRIAQTIYDDRTFDELPILADALEDAGCPSIALSEHCRETGRHGRGCWAIDVLLGREPARIVEVEPVLLPGKAG